MTITTTGIAARPRDVPSGVVRLLAGPAVGTSPIAVRECLGDCYDELHRMGVRAGLADAAEAMAATRLRHEPGIGLTDRAGPASPAGERTRARRYSDGVTQTG